jgi:hypothetical protein
LCPEKRSCFPRLPPFRGSFFICVAADRVFPCYRTNRPRAPVRNPSVGEGGFFGCPRRF